MEGPLLVLSGPGSGKTRVLTQRIARLISDAAAFPSQILAVTFTNKAADEMRRRVEALVGPSAREIAMGTFHSVCLRMLRRHAEAVGLSERFLVYDDGDQLVLLKECLAALDIDRERLPPRAALDRISRAKDACLSPELFAEQSAGNPFLERIAKIYRLYQRRLGELQAVDFGDLIRLTVGLLEGNEALRESCRQRWRYVLVDEYQDTNHAQYRMISAIAGGHRNLCVVGDDDQSIYRWRGADIGNILRFEKDYPGAAVIRLEQNYRSTGAIIAAASAVVARNASRKSKSIWTANDAGESVALLTCDSERREACAVAERIAGAVAAGGTYADAAIFYRTNAQSRPLEEVFRERGIPYRIYGGMRFYERAEVKDVLAYLRLLIDAGDDVSFGRVINVPQRGLGKTTIEKLRAFAGERGLSLYGAIPSFVGEGQARAAQARALTAFHAAVGELSALAAEPDLGLLLRTVLEKSGYVEELAAASTVESEARLENVNELVAACSEFIPAGEGQPLLQFLDQVALVSDADAVDERLGAVTMMTLHIAKGLEFPRVFMVGMEEGLIPHARSCDDPDELEEERRLCYVGMTRAMRQLTLTHALKRSIFGAERYNVASRFLTDIPPQVCERISLATGFGAREGMSRDRTFEDWEPGSGSRDAGYRFAPKVMRRPRRDAPIPDPRSPVTDPRSPITEDDFDQRPPDERGEGLFKGLRVRHPSFGAGVILACERTSAGHKVTVRFDAAGEKRLIAELAGLIPA